MKKYNKSDIYNMVIDITKNTGQGMAGFVFDRIQNGWNMVNELIEEGLLRKYVHTFPATGMPPSIFVSLEDVGTYCVEKDEEENGNKHALSFMRYYLNIGDGTEFNGKVKLSDVIDYNMAKYKSWLMNNLEGLEAIKRLTNVELEDSISVEVLEFIKSKEWYKNNETVEVSLSTNKEQLKNREERVRLTKELIRLMTDDKYKEDVIKHKIELEEDKGDIKHRERVIALLERCEDKTIPLHDYINTFEKNTWDKFEELGTVTEL
jgi:hypothetical protein